MAPLNHPIIAARHLFPYELVDVSHAERNAAAARNATLRVYPRGGHNGILAWNRAAYGEDVTGFLRGLRG